MNPLVDGNLTRGKRTVEYFDSVAADYSSRYSPETPGGAGFKLRRERVMELFDKPGGKVLDVGCGPGVVVEQLRELNCAFWGVDPSPGMIEQGQKQFGELDDVHFAVGAAEELGFPDGFFDAVLCMGVLERVKDERAALAEMARVLKSGGTLIVTLPNKFSPYLLWRDYLYYPLISLLRPLYYKLRGRAARAVIPGHTLYTERSYAALAGRNGCEVTDVVYCGFLFFLSPLESLYPRLAAAVMERLEGMRQTALRRLAFCIVVKARKS